MVILIQDLIKKHCRVLILELIALLLSLALFFVPKVQYSFGADAFELGSGVYMEGLLEVSEPGIYIDNEIAGQHTIIYSPSSDLHPGSYKVYLKYLNNDNNNTYSAESDHNTNSVINHRINVSLGINDDPNYRKELTLNTWQKVKGYKISFNYSGNGYMYLYGLDIVETNWWKAEILLIVILISIVVNILMLLRDTKDGRDTFLYVYAFLLAIFTSTLSLSVDFLSGHDASYHLGRMEALAQAISSGNLPLRVSDYWLGGLGYASSLFYCDLLLFPAACLRSMGASVQGAWKVYDVMVNLATGFVGVYSFKKITRSRVGALVATTLYMFSAYRLSCMYVRFAVGDYSAQIFLPLVLYGIIRIYDNYETKEMLTESVKCAIPFTLGVSGLVLSHIQTTLMTAIFVFVFLLVNFRRTIKKSIMVRLLCSLAGVLLLNMWFIFPFFELSSSLKVMHEAGRAGMYRASGAYLWQLLNFFPQGGGYSFTAYESAGDGEMPFTVAPAAIGVFLYLILRMAKLIRNEGTRVKIIKRSDGLMITALVAMYLTTIYFPWDFVEQLSPLTSLITQTLMCPWRFLGITWAISSALSGILYVLLREEKQELSKYASLYIGLVCIVATIGAGYFTTTRADSSEWTYLFDNEDFTNPSIIGGEYLPGDTADETLGKTVPIAGDGVLISEWKRENGAINLTVDNSAGIDSYVDVPYLYYKGYRAKLEATGELLQTMTNGEALVRVIIPSGVTGKVKIYYEEPLHWKCYEVTSVLMSVLLVAGYLGANCHFCECIEKRHG